MNISRSAAAKRGWQTRKDRSAPTTWKMYKPRPEHSPDAIQATLNQRGKTHGDFSENARVMQGMKRVARTGDNWLKFLRGAPEGLVDVQAEALEMIIHKIGRIITGNPNEADHWADIEGYARLARERLAK